MLSKEQKLVRGDGQLEHRIEEFLSDAVYASFGIQNIIADMRPDLSGLQGADHRVAITQRQLGKTPN
jgi:hypothetical protein